MFSRNAVFIVVLVLVSGWAVPALAQTILTSNEVSGTWTTGGSPYYVEGDIRIPAGETLTIEPGVEVLFQDWYGLTVNGTLSAVGTESEPILFGGGHDTAGWVSINIIDATDVTELTHVIVENASRGGIYVENVNPLISHSTIRNNKGGGIHMVNSDASLIGNVIIDNVNSSSGGGVYMLNSNPELTDNVIQNNAVNRPPSGFTPSTGAGGGIFARSSDPLLVGNVISDNSISASRRRGGGIHLYYADALILNNTISGNTAGDGAGIYLYYSELNLLNSILWNDGSNEEIYVSEYGSSTDAVNIAYSNIEGGQGGIVTNENGTINWLEGNIDIDPLFVDADNGDYHLQSGSPVVDAGTDYFELDGDVWVDLSSTEYSGSAPDLGGFELGSAGSVNQPPVAVASVTPDHGSAPLFVQFSSADSYDPDGHISSVLWEFGDGSSTNDSHPSHTYTSVNVFQVRLTVTDDEGATHSEIIEVEVTDGSSIYAGEVFGTWDAAGSPYRIEGDVVVPDGETLTIEPGVEVLFQDWYGLTVNGTLFAVGTESEPIRFGGGHPTAGWVSIDIIDGTDDTQLSHVIVENASHSGIYVENVSPHISYSTIRNNEGGGIQLVNSDASLIGNTIVGNINSSSGGGVYMIDGNPELTGNVIRSNAVIRPPSGYIPSTGAGGGIFARSSDPVLIGNEISNNSVSASNQRGGGIHFYYAEPYLINNTISGNTANEGAGIYLYNSEPVLINTILWHGATDDEIFVSDGGVSKTITVAYSDIRGGQGGIFTNNNAIINWLEGNVDADPLFVDGPGGDYQLQDGSPVVDKGTDYFEWNGEIVVDLSPSEYNSTAPDMGAYESQYTGINNLAPVAVAAADPGSGSAPLTVQFNSDDSTDPDGWITSYAWEFGDGNTSNNANPAHTYAEPGTFQAMLTITDDKGATSTAAVAITVTQASQNQLHVQGQSVTRQQWFWSFYRGLDVVLITDQENQPVSGVTVTASYSGPNSGETSGVTGPDGTVTLYSGWKRNPSGTWCFDITAVSKDGFTYDPQSNGVTQQCE